MKLAAVYNVWSDSVELLEASINSIRNVVDTVIVVVSHTSNHGVPDSFAFDVCMALHNQKLIDIVSVVEPDPRKNASHNEAMKRQHGVDIAKSKDCTHFLCMDSDECYKEQEFLIASDHITIEGIRGSVVRLRTYFAEPTLMLKERENYYVPFIHELTKITKVGFGGYPYWADPTRRVKGHSIKSVKLLEGIDMHHYSYVRNDINAKLENSSASTNLMNQKSVILEDLRLAKPAYHTQFYNMPLVEVRDIFDIKSGLEKWKRKEQV